MKVISVTVPCYNSQAYMRKCVDSLLSGGDDVEIIIVNDGSKDDTLKIANEYKEKYPDIVKVVDKENGGHGSGVNAGVREATGVYFKVVDSDDWVDEEEFKKLIAKIKEHIAAGIEPDLYITNYIYDHVQDNTQYVSSYEKKLPEGKICGWDKMKPFRFSHMLLMHALLFKHKVLVESNTVLPEHTFYVDDIYSYKPLPYAKTICYLNLNLYHYFIGRADQSVNMSNFVKRYDQQLRVMRCMIDSYKWEEIKRMPKGLKKYMWHALQAIMATTMLFVCAEKSEERVKGYNELWEHIKERDKPLYRKLKHWSYSTPALLLPWKPRGKVLVFGYKVLCKRIKLG